MVVHLHVAAAFSNKLTKKPTICHPKSKIYPILMALYHPIKSLRSKMRLVQPISKIFSILPMKFINVMTMNLDQTVLVLIIFLKIVNQQPVK